MKRLVFLAVIGLMGIAILGAAPVNTSQSQTTASLTVDSQWTTTWVVADSMILNKTDTSYTFYHATATVVIKPGQKLYYGLKDGASAVVDTFILQLAGDADSAMTVQIGVAYIDSLDNQADEADSIQFVMAVSGTSKQERVTVTSIRLTGTIINKDPA